MKKTRKIIRTILLVLVSAAFLMAAFAKLTHNQMEVQLFTSVNLIPFLSAIGILEILVVVLLWFKPVRGLGVLLGTAIMGGAIAETFSIGMLLGAWTPGLILLMLWAIAKLSRGGCHYCKIDGHCHCSCAGCKDCTGMSSDIKPEMCNCKPDCNCEKGVCSC